MMLYMLKFPLGIHGVNGHGAQHDDKITILCVTGMLWKHAGMIMYGQDQCMQNNWDDVNVNHHKIVCSMELNNFVYRNRNYIGNVVIFKIHE